MSKLDNIKGIIFDYGGTIDTNGKHWAEVLWSKYCNFDVPVDKASFKEAYVYGERTLALQPLIKPEHNFYDVLLIKVQVQLSYLIEKGLLSDTEQVRGYSELISESCYNFVLDTIKTAIPTLDLLQKRYKLVLVSNFYGNIHQVLKDFNLLCHFEDIIESSVVGVRKPDPAIFTLGVNALGLEPEEVMVIGDSFSKDILPAKKAGCFTVWLKGIGWEEITDESQADIVISDLFELRKFV